MEPTKNDWKLYRELIGVWQEAYIEKIISKYILCLSDEKESPANRFWASDKMIRRDKNHPGVRIELSKQNMIYDLAALLHESVITPDDIADFSEETKDAVNFLISHG